MLSVAKLVYSKIQSFHSSLARFRQGSKGPGESPGEGLALGSFHHLPRVSGLSAYASHLDPAGSSAAKSGEAGLVFHDPVKIGSRPMEHSSTRAWIARDVALWRTSAPVSNRFASLHAIAFRGYARSLCG